MTKLQEIRAGLELLGEYERCPDIQAYQNRLIVVLTIQKKLDARDIDILIKLNWEIDGRNFVYRGL